MIIANEFVKLEVYENAVSDHQQQLFVPRFLHYTATSFSRNKMTELVVTSREEGHIEVMAKDISDVDAKLIELIMHFLSINDKGVK